MPRSKVGSQPPVPLSPFIKTSNVPIVKPPSVALESTNNTNELVRPSLVDEATWEKYISYRKIVLSQNQPVEFYARVVDQDGQPVEGAKLKISLVRWNEAIFVATNYLHWDAGAAHQQKFFDLYSDANGWIQLTGETGSFLDMTGLSKDGYISGYPNGNFGGVHYEFRGVRTPTQNILMTNSWNPQKGYMLHLWKKGATERLVRWNKGFRITQDSTDQNISLLPAAENETGYPDLVLKTPKANPNIQEGDRAYDRWIIIEASPNAEIQETSMIYPYSAPQGNYGRDFKFLYQPDSRDGDGWTRRFYVKARNGKLFASLGVSFASTSGLNMQVDTIVNPNGSRNLEPDPDKLITDAAEIHAIDLATRPQ